MRSQQRRAHAEIDEEIIDHLERESERLELESGCTAEDAQMSALQRFGDVDTVRKECTLVLRWHRRRRILKAVMCVLLGSGVAATVWFTVQRRDIPNVASMRGLIRSICDHDVENRLYGLKRRGDWQGLLAECNDAIANHALTAQSRAYAALCQIEACRALSQSDEAAWIVFASIGAQLSDRPDVEWLKRKLLADRRDVGRTSITGSAA